MEIFAQNTYLKTARPAIGHITNVVYTLSESVLVPTYIYKIKLPVQLLELSLFGSVKKSKRFYFKTCIESQETIIPGAELKWQDNTIDPSYTNINNKSTSAIIDINYMNCKMKS